MTALASAYTASPASTISKKRSRPLPTPKRADENSQLYDIASPPTADKVTTVLYRNLPVVSEGGLLQLLQEMNINTNGPISIADLARKLGWGNTDFIRELRAKGKTSTNLREINSAFFKDGVKDDTGRSVIDLNSLVSRGYLSPAPRGATQQASPSAQQPTDPGKNWYGQAPLPSPLETRRNSPPVDERPKSNGTAAAGNVTGKQDPGRQPQYDIFGTPIPDDRRVPRWGNGVEALIQPGDAPLTQGADIDRASGQPVRPPRVTVREGRMNGMNGSGGTIGVRPIDILDFLHTPQPNYFPNGEIGYISPMISDATYGQVLNNYNTQPVYYPASLFRNYAVAYGWNIETLQRLFPEPQYNWKLPQKMGPNTMINLAAGGLLERIINLVGPDPQAFDGRFACRRSQMVNLTDSPNTNINKFLRLDPTLARPDSDTGTTAANRRRHKTRTA